MKGLNEFTKKTPMLSFIFRYDKNSQYRSFNFNANNSLSEYHGIRIKGDISSDL